MKKQIGPLKLWQWGAIVGGGLGLYLLTHKKSNAAGESAEGNLLSGPSGLPPEPGGGAGGGTGGGVGGEALSGIPGPVGEPGPAGPAGEPGAEGKSELTPAQTDILNRAAQALNNPPIPSARKAKPISTKPRSKAKKHKPTQSHKAKAHKVIHHQAVKENRSTIRVPAAKHAPSGAAGRAPRSHGLPNPLKVNRPGVPSGRLPGSHQRGVAPKPHAQKPKPFRRRGR